MDVVSQIVSVRARQADGLLNTVAASIAAHAALAAVVALGPSIWGAVPVPEEEPVMTISLGGVPGPRTGMTQLSSTPVQQVQPIEARKVIEPVRPPAAREPEMVELKKNVPPKRETKSPTDAKDPKSRTPTKGEQLREGTAVSPNPAKGLGFGLSQGGGGAGGYLDVSNFCCPEYLSTMANLINQRWDSRQQAAGTTVVKFVIQRDGRLTGIQVEQSSGYPALDLLAQRALVLTNQLPPLPAAFTEPSLVVHLVFQYQR